MKRIIVVFVVLLLAGSVFAQHKYMTLGRNPMIPGGVTVAQATERGWKPFQLPKDTFCDMNGASGETVKGWLPKGTWVAKRPDGTIVILACGNTTNIIAVWITETIRDTTVIEKKVPGPIQYVDKPYPVPGPTQYVDRPYPVPGPTEYIPCFVWGPQTNFIAGLNAPNVESPVAGGISFNGAFERGNTFNISAYGAAAAAAAAAASSSSSSTSTTPTSAAGTSGSGGSSSGSSGGSENNIHNKR